MPAVTICKIKGSSCGSKQNCSHHSSTKIDAVSRELKKKKDFCLKALLRVSVSHFPQFANHSNKLPLQAFLHFTDLYQISLWSCILQSIFLWMETSPNRLSKLFPIFIIQLASTSWQTAFLATTVTVIKLDTKTILVFLLASSQVLRWRSFL